MISFEGSTLNANKIITIKYSDGYFLTLYTFKKIISNGFNSNDSYDSSMLIKHLNHCQGFWRLFSVAISSALDLP